METFHDRAMDEIKNFPDLKSISELEVEKDLISAKLHLRNRKATVMKFTACGAFFSLICDKDDYDVSLYADLVNGETLKLVTPYDMFPMSENEAHKEAHKHSKRALKVAKAIHDKTQKN